MPGLAIVQINFVCGKNGERTLDFAAYPTNGVQQWSANAKVVVLIAQKKHISAFLPRSDDVGRALLLMCLHGTSKREKVESDSVLIYH